VNLIHNLKIVFIVGCQRTGTTLIGNILGAHPQAFLIDEPDGLYPWLEAILSNQDKVVASALFRKCCQKARNSYLDPVIKCDNEGNLAASVTHLILKAPNLTYSADRIAETFPNSFCVFSYRDIRDVVVSMGKLKTIPMVQNQLKRIKDSPALSVQHKKAVLALEDSDISPHQARAHIAKIKTELRSTFNHTNIQKLEVCYEDLVQQPAIWKRKLLQHIQLTTDIDSNHTNVMTGWGPGLNYRLNKINTFSIDQWKHHLTKDQENDIWEIAGSLMMKLGYSRTPERNPKIRLWGHINSDCKYQPVIATGRGGSGTRLLSEILQMLNVFLGNKMNKMGDSLEWVGLIYKIAIERTQLQPQKESVHWRFPLQETAAEILTEGNYTGEQPWGWKLPETMLALPEIFDAFAQGRLIHLIRHPVDASLRRSHMTSRPGNLVGKSVLQAAYRELGWSEDKIATDPDYLHNAASWLYQVSAVSRYGADVLGTERYLEVHYEDLCSNPAEVIGSIVSFLGIQLTVKTERIEIDQKRLRSWTPPDPRSNEVWEICGRVAKNLGYDEY